MAVPRDPQPRKGGTPEDAKLISYPVEHLGDVIREKHFANRVFDSLAAVTAQTSAARVQWAQSSAACQSLTGWPLMLTILPS